MGSVRNAWDGTRIRRTEDRPRFRPALSQPTNLTRPQPSDLRAWLTGLGRSLRAGLDRSAFTDLPCFWTSPDTQRVFAALAPSRLTVGALAQAIGWRPTRLGPAYGRRTLAPQPSAHLLAHPNSFELVHSPDMPTTSHA